MSNSAFLNECQRAFILRAETTNALAGFDGELVRRMDDSFADASQIPFSS